MLAKCELMFGFIVSSRTPEKLVNKSREGLVS